MSLYNARKNLGIALTEWRDAGAHPETVVFAIEDLLKVLTDPGPVFIKETPELIEALEAAGQRPGDSATEGTK